MTTITFSLTGFRLFVVPTTAGVGCRVAIGTKLASESVKKEENFFKKNIYTRSNNTVQFFIELKEKSLDQAEHKEFTDMNNRYNNAIRASFA